MKILNLFFLLSMLLCFKNVAAQIKLDQFGYRTISEKVAVLSDPEIGFNASESYEPSVILEVRNTLTEDVVFQDTPQIWNSGETHDQSGDKGYWFDFSSLETPGSYYIYDSQGISSYEFVISDDVYWDVMSATSKMFYYNRCNSEKLEEHAGEKWTDGMNFMNPLQDAECRNIFDSENSALQRDLSGGWFDAGDYNKYVTFAESPVHNLLWAYQENPQSFTDLTNIPESENGIPDLIDELKWELDWLLKMVNLDGSVIIKMGAQNYSENADSPPSINTDQRFYGNTCTSASLAAAGMLAHAAEVFDDINGMESYASELLSTAELCFNYALPFIESQNLETDCDNGEIVSGDADRNESEQMSSAVTAAVHLFSITENMGYDTFLLDYAFDEDPIANTFWSGYKLFLNDALLHYTTLQNGSASLQQAILTSISTDANNNWSGYYGFSHDDLYRAFMPDWAYHWGSNLPKAGFAILNMQLVSYGIHPANQESFELKAGEALHYFHGVNPIDKVMMSNMYEYGADNSMNEIYHGWFNDGTIYDHALNSSNGPAPGFIVGGPNASFGNTSISPPAGQPAQKAYKDWNTGFPENSWEISEPAIYYQAVYLRLLANFVDPCSNPVNSGCTDPLACNYDPIVTCDNGLCEYDWCDECLGDFNGDLAITAADLAFILVDYGCFENCAGDMNNDDVVSVFDLAAFLSVFGTFCYP